MKKKLTNARGETLVELMASILIGTLSTALLLGGVMAASSIDRDVKALDEAYYTALSAAEGRTAPLPGGPFQLKIENKGSGTARNFPIHLYGGSGMYSYDLKAAGP